MMKHTTFLKVSECLIKIRTNRNLSNRKKLNLEKMKQYMAGVYSETAFKRLRKVLEPYESEE